MKWFISAFKKAFNFRDRSRRQEYWMFTLVAFLITLLLTWIEVAAGLEIEENIGLLTTIFSILIFIPSLSLTIRRLHDTGKSGWWILLTFVPFIGWIILLVFMVQTSEPGINSFGSNPKVST